MRKGVIHPHEGSGDTQRGSNGMTVSRSSIPMRGQESTLAMILLIDGGVIHPHEGSGDGPVQSTGRGDDGHPSP